MTKIEYHWRSPSHCDTYIVAAAESEAAAATGHPRRPWPARPAARRQLAAHRLCDLAAPDVALARRRFVYGRALYSLHVGSNRLSQYREVTPAMLASDGALQSRARAWLRRELRVFPFLAPDHPHAADLAGPASARAVRNAEFLLEYIIAILKAVDLYGAAGQAEELLQEYLGRENTLLFLHELKAFLRSPFARPEDWDRKVQYRVKLPLRFPE